MRSTGMSHEDREMARLKRWHAETIALAIATIACAVAAFNGGIMPQIAPKSDGALGQIVTALAAWALTAGVTASACAYLAWRLGDIEDRIDLLHGNSSAGRRREQIE